MQNILDILPEGILIFDMDFKEIIFANKAIYRIINKTQESQSEKEKHLANNNQNMGGNFD